MAKKPAKSKQPEIVKAIKGFDADLKCRGFQYEVGKSYEYKGGVVMCSSGFHACEGSPFDVWGYYGPVDAEGKLARYADVSMAGFVRDSGQSNSKIAAAKITIDAEISLPDFVRRAVSWVIDATKGKGDDPSGDYARIGSSGYSARIVAEGANSVVASAGPGTSVSGADGTWISVAEFKDDKCVGFATGCIGKDGLLPNTPYIARGGKLVPAA